MNLYRIKSAFVDTAGKPVRKIKESYRAAISLAGTITWQISPTLAWPDEEEALIIGFQLGRCRTEEGALHSLVGVLEKDGLRWLFRRGKKWFLDTDLMQLSFKYPSKLPWLKGSFEVTPTVTKEGDSWRNVTFEITEAYMKAVAPRRIFLSHTGTDKEMVRGYHETLQCLGFEPWLDEEALAAGANLERALLEGMKNSCAAVFFVTTNYKDEGYLATEIDYAIREKRERGDRFAIVTLVWAGTRADVPELLRPYVWKTPKDSLEALREILRALPLQLPVPEWKTD